MRIFLDECVNAEVKRAFSDDAVQTVTAVGWSALEDGPLLSRLNGEFDVFITIDKSIEHQQNYRKFRFGIVVAHVVRNDVRSWTPLFADLNKLAARVQPGELLHVFGPRP